MKEKIKTKKNGANIENKKDVENYVKADDIIMKKNIENKKDVENNEEGPDAETELKFEEEDANEEYELENKTPLYLEKAIENEINYFNQITISLASSADVLKESFGEVLTPETINYRTHKPEPNGLFCERIFGPIKDFECTCGRFKNFRYPGFVCQSCGVEIIDKKVRRKRIGHINLVVPIVHIWGFRSFPNKIGYILNLSSQDLEMIIYYERYVVIQQGITKKKNLPFNKLELLSEEEYLKVIKSLPKGNQKLSDKNTKKFIAKMGGEALEDLLKKLDYKLLSYKLKTKLKIKKSYKQKFDDLKRLNVIEGVLEGKNKGGTIESLMLRTLPVIPPELRPLVPLDCGRFATSDLNDLYRKIIIRNNRLKKLIEIPNLFLISFFY